MNSTICWFPLKPTEKPNDSRMLNNAKVLRYSDFCCNQMSMFQRSTNSVIYDEGDANASSYNGELIKIKFEAELIISY